MIVFHSLFIFTRIDQSETTSVSFLELVSFLKVFIGFQLALFWSELDFFAREHALLHDLAIVIDPLLFAFGTEVEQVDGVCDELLLDAPV